MFRTLKGKLTVLILALIFLLNMGLLMFVDSILYNNLKDKIKGEMENVKNIAVNAIMYNSTLTFEEQKEAIWKGIYENNNGINGFIGLFDEDGNKFESKGELATEEYIENIIKESINKKSIIKFSPERGLVSTYIYPIYLQGEFKCNLVIQKAFFEDQRYYKSIISEIVVVQFCLFVIIGLTINTAINRIVTPIKKLSAEMKRFGDGELVESIKVYSKDEVGEVTESFNKMKDEREKLQNISREFFNNATHELKTPITSIYSYVQILKEHDLDKVDKEFKKRAIDRMALECVKLKDLVQKLLDVSRGSINSKRETEVIEINELVEDLVDGLAIRCDRFNKSIITNLQDVEVKGVRQEIEEIILNLLDNAIKYSNGSTINVLLVNEDHIYPGKTLIVENKINQIPENIKGKLLEPFIKYNSFNEIYEDEISSSGLGLYLCTQLAEKNDVEFTYRINNENIVFICQFN
ncbi:histidine kinase dimerization/phospho-acceptor domain-containing protein [Clostridium paraputrificum]|uniref:sensor histidine kinase n=1 Tax=Clostridium paraputrificum TaxID=29363 RepID=UPI003D32655A